MKALRVLTLVLPLEPVSALRNHVSPAEDQIPHLPADLMMADELQQFVPPEPEETELSRDVNDNDTKTLKEKLESSANYFGVWIAGVWGDCVEGCDTDHPLKHRTIDCHDQFSANRIPTHYCKFEDKPNNWRRCDCALESCTTVKDKWRCPTLEGGTVTGVLQEKLRYRTPYQMGCFETMNKPSWSSNDTTFDYAQFGQLMNQLSPRYEKGCMNWTSDEPCETGLPFYAYMNWTKISDSKVLPMWECYHFCLSKGFDIAGVEYGKVCRCGNTAVNRLFLKDAGLYNGSAYQKMGLTFQPYKLTATSQMPHHPRGWKPPRPLQCPLQIVRYDGIYIDEAVPMGYWRLNADDVNYMEAMKYGKEIPMLADSDMADVADPTVPDDKPLGWEPWTTRDCSKDRCDFYPKWPYKTLGVHFGMEEKFHEYTEVWYHFESNATQSMKETFRKAAEHFTRYTCIVFKEVSHTQTLETPVRPVVQVGVWNDNYMCAAKKFAPGDPLFLKFDMGMCNSVLFYGEVLSQMMRVLGIRAEHNRPDAIKTFRGKGPHLLVRWQHYHQWGAGLDKSIWDHSSVWDYMGSAAVGYAPYDFDSITQIGHGGQWVRLDGSGSYAGPYGAPLRFMTKPMTMMSRVGQRIGLSKGDIMQLNDVYQCKTKNHGNPLIFSDENADMKYAALGGSIIGWLMGGIYSGLDMLQRMFLGGVSGASVGHTLGYRMYEQGVDYTEWYKVLFPTME